MNIRFKEKTNTWPAFVDLFSNLVIILIFLLIVFVFLWTTTSVFNKDSGTKAIAELKKTNEEQAQKITQMTADEEEAKRLLILARAELENLTQDNLALNTELAEVDISVEELIADYEAKISELTTQLNQANVDKAATKQLEQDRKDLQTELEAQRASLSEQLLKLQMIMA